MDSQDSLRRKVAEELEEQKALRNRSPSPENTHAKALGLFLAECIKHTCLSRKEFADALNMEQELAEAILDGVLPVSELDDDLIQQMSSVAGCSPELLRAFLV